MARERKEVTVDGVVYSICQIKPTKSTIVFIKLTKVFGPALGKLFGDNDISIEGAKGVAGDLKNMPLDEILEVVADRIDEENLMKIFRTLLHQTYAVNAPTMTLGVESNFDQHFMDAPGGIFHIFKVMKEVLVLHYADFFGGISTLGKPQEENLTDTESQMVP